ncbi:MFS transporter [Nocardioides sp. DS6]|uniref:MFS transporter n=1 Tax=Nocardioides eburneus TaxID=3231482 RepID=A0ABV3SY67_9ACTN
MTHPASDPATDPRTGPAARSAASTRTLALVMAVACGLTVANLYYGQPLLDLVADAFDVGQGTASLVVTLTQVGYAAGLLFLVPLGDLLENRRLVTRLLLGTAVSLAVAAASPVFPLFLALSVLIGITSVIVQILVPMAAHLAPEGRQGEYVGTVMSGLLLGILLARTVSSALAEVLGWRAIYVVSAVLMVVLSLVLRRMLPVWRPDHSSSYAGMLASVWRLVRTEPVLRQRAFAQAMMFGAFTAYWTAIAYELIDEHGFSQGEIALFALVGAGGAAAAPLAGRIADRGHGDWASGLALVVASATFVLSLVGQGSWVLLGVAAVVLDFAVQSHQVMGQHVIYSLRPEARARINTAYMTTIFVGGSIASLFTGWLHGHGGWPSVCVLGIVLPLLGLASWLALRVRTRARAVEGM